MKEYHVLNLGAGVQSTALYLLAREPNPKVQFDLAVFADTGEEPVAVYTHLNHLQSLGAPEIWVRSVGKLGDDLNRHHRSLVFCNLIAAIPWATTRADV